MEYGEDDDERVARQIEVASIDAELSQIEEQMQHLLLRQSELENRRNNLISSNNSGIRQPVQRVFCVEVAGREFSGDFPWSQEVESCS